MNLRKFLTELKRRNVYKVADIYALGDWGRSPVGQPDNNRFLIEE